MMTTEERYFADLNADEQEFMRLQLLEEFLDPITQPALVEAGVRPGARVLEVGPGAGSMLRWLSDKVGADGEVVAIDINPRFVKDIDLPNVTVLEADLMDPPSDLGEFDVVYTRYVLLHLPDTFAAARSLKQLTRPGGSVVVVDIDWRTVRAADPAHPLASTFNNAMETVTEVLRDVGIMNLEFGMKAAVVLENAGFEAVGCRGNTRLLRGGSHEVAWYRQSVFPADAAIRAYAPERAAELEPVLNAYDDPSFLFSSPVDVVATGTRPEI